MAGILTNKCHLIILTSCLSILHNNSREKWMKKTLTKNSITIRATSHIKHLWQRICLMVNILLILIKCHQTLICTLLMLNILHMDSRIYNQEIRNDRLWNPTPIDRNTILLKNQPPQSKKVNKFTKNNSKTKQVWLISQVVQLKTPSVVKDRVGWIN